MLRSRKKRERSEHTIKLEFSAGTYRGKFSLDSRECLDAAPRAGARRYGVPVANVCEQWGVRRRERTGIYNILKAFGEAALSQKPTY